MTGEPEREIVDANWSPCRAAIDSGCDVLWTEDLTDRQLLRGVQMGSGDVDLNTMRDRAVRRA